MAWAVNLIHLHLGGLMNLDIKRTKLRMIHINIMRTYRDIPLRLLKTQTGRGKYSRALSEFCC